MILAIANDNIHDHDVSNDKQATSYSDASQITIMNLPIFQQLPVSLKYAGLRTNWAITRQ